MLLNCGEYKDVKSGLTYKINKSIDFSSKPYFLINGENGVGKSRFIEGVLLKEAKKKEFKTLYFGQDIENQILTFKLIALVKKFLQDLKSNNTFFRTIFLNDETGNSSKLDFNEESTLTPSKEHIKTFIQDENFKYNNLDMVIFDEADKYFESEEDFFTLIERINAKSILIISHIIDDNKENKIQLKNMRGVVEIE